MADLTTEHIQSSTYAAPCYWLWPAISALPEVSYRVRSSWRGGGRRGGDPVAERKRL